MSLRVSPQLVRYVVNGVIATAVHYAALRFCLEVLQMNSAGLANMLAAPVGIATSFLGSRYYVFQRRETAIVQQAVRFMGLYAAIAALHGTARLSALPRPAATSGQIRDGAAVTR